MIKITALSFLLICLCSVIVNASLSDKPFTGGFNPKLPADEEYSIHSFLDKNDQAIPTSSAVKQKEALYEAYNLLHSLAQDFHKPFDSPAVVVVGHQTSGKSALIEALMGFQFNQVGGGTKTRRPIALRMQYNPNCATPVCFLTMENGKEEQRSLEDIQAYIESENKRLERDATRSFDPREINIRMEYKYCPNMIVIDTPGLIHPPKARQMTVQQRQHAQASREAEQLVLEKIKCEDYIILCVEDTIDWKHAMTRNIVMQADPQLTRTVMVNPKLDTKMVQFSEGEDLEDFLQAPLIHTLFSQIMGGPFFTSIPSGRVGMSKEYDNNDAFVQALKQAEKHDRSVAVSKLGPVKARAALQNVGVSRLRTFLESKVEDCYRRNVAKIVPLLQSDLRSAEAQLAEIDAELKSLSVDHLRQMANEYRERFAKELSNAIQGSVKASPMEWGETLEMEAARSCSFLQQGQTDLEADEWQRILDEEIGNNNQKLYGGAQFHRSLREFTVAVRHMAAQVVTEDEIANANGMGDRHNGANFMRAACVIAMAKADLSFSPMLEALKTRTAHVMKRLFPIVEEMVRKSAPGGGVNLALGAHSATFQQMMRQAFEKFVDQKVELSTQRCREDLDSLIRYVTFDQEDKGGASALYRLLPTPKKMAEIYHLAVEKKEHSEDGEEEEEDVLSEDRPRARRPPVQGNRAPRRVPPAMGWRIGRGTKKPALPPVAERVLADWKQANSRAPAKSSSNNNNNMKKLANKKPPTMRGGEGYAVTPVSSANEAAELSDHYRIMQLTEEMVSGTTASRTSALVTALVQFIISSWRNHFARATQVKFNSFLLVPFMDDFPSFLRNEMDSMYNAGMGELFDIAETRRTLQARRAELLAECTANAKLQGRFDQIAAQLDTTPSSSTAGGGSGGSNNSRDSSGSSNSGGGSGGGMRRPPGQRFARSPSNINTNANTNTHTNTAGNSGGASGAQQGGAAGLGMAGQANLGGSLEASQDTDSDASDSLMEAVAPEPVTAEQYNALMKDL